MSVMARRRVRCSPTSETFLAPDRREKTHLGSKSVKKATNSVEVCVEPERSVRQPSLIAAIGCLSRSLIVC